MANSIDLEFADGEYTFALPLAQIDELQRKCDAGIGAIFARVMKGAGRSGEDITLHPAMAEFYAVDLVEVIRQGLIGGKRGMVDGKEVAVSPPFARRLVDNYVLNQPLIRAWEIAFVILSAVIVGYSPPETPGKKGSAAASETPESKAETEA